MTARPSRRFLEKRIVRDFKAPRSADDLDMINGWQCIPIPPTADDGWFILEARDRKTVWGRWLEIGGTA
jgi:hypothetical protein